MQREFLCLSSQQQELLDGWGRGAAATAVAREKNKFTPRLKHAFNDAVAAAFVAAAAAAAAAPLLPARAVAASVTDASCALPGSAPIAGAREKFLPIMSAIGGGEREGGGLLGRRARGGDSCGGVVTSGDRLAPKVQPLRLQRFKPLSRVPQSSQQHWQC